MLAGQTWQDNDLVFSDPLGGPLYGISVYRYHFLPLVRRAGVRTYGFTTCGIRQQR